ncbi:hypothetical protein A3D00_04530 [Candidatus Woesebacteria bacterium RIFCSPHIGHO2_02_FULL_38_9]|uniref:Tyrosine specific protein phosphatases domain-containing protein n=1 Tax=Candidatus Woesebacteria bacterium RIFCSPHIGHO2_01_FULL_39_28 TaxID=1802496 RepID=A0A1F7YLA5_9BACT|nr:MAG: hypothetical protein A2627_00350 [Candidatus Woesebacteria bacterium RIFCSPHIGHO2_01_FULL_39_28]OGM31893.1 MAG: hypothetical protein A3D00_04530 [Candidatus Woesebacteria bacterium RIFCSPHIGHO2_02_FULL_38_9]OGM56737.1 MAG: hypothetical protein A3A50_05270 [Candidatus Woesebacteria bacterium RIFCSPLOWO2_01_FULL_38_20]
MKDHATDYSQITEQIFIGSDLCRGLYCPLHSVEFKKLGICAEVNLEIERNETPTPGVDTYIWLPTPDLHAPTQDQLAIGSSAIGEMVGLGNKIYVHCKEGLGRSPTMVVAYLVRYKGMQVDKSIDFIAQRRPGIHIEDSQRMALVEFSKKWSK